GIGVLIDMSLISISGSNSLDMHDLLQEMGREIVHEDGIGCGKLCFSKCPKSLPNTIRYLYWERYPLQSLPSTFSAENLVELLMPHSELEKLWNKSQYICLLYCCNLGNLKLIDLSYSYHLAEVPDLSHSRKIQHINHECCASLVQIQSYFQYLDKLTYIHLGSCWNLKYLPEMPGNVEFLNLKRAAIKELPLSVWSNEKISFLDIEYCEYLEHLPSSS
ncbi:PREDICTED: TMV resistance, partial [Prunus dulcis]